MEGYITEVSEVTQELYNSIYKRILKGIDEYQTQINISEFLIKTDLVYSIMNRITYENPDIFFIEKTSCTFSNKIFQDKGFRIAVNFRITYSDTNEEIENKKQTLNNFKNDIKNQFKGINSELEKILFSVNYFKNLNVTLETVDTPNIYDVITTKEIPVNKTYILTSYLLFIFKIKFYISWIGSYNRSIGIKLLYKNNYYNTVLIKESNGLLYYLCLKSDNYILPYLSVDDNYVIDKFDFEIIECIDDKYSFIDDKLILN